jgi:hypothetical protein
MEFTREDTLGIYMAGKYSIGGAWSPLSNVVFCDHYNPGGGGLEDGIVGRTKPVDGEGANPPTAFVSLAGGREARFRLTIHPKDAGRSVRVDAFDITGRLVRRIDRSSSVEGTRAITWDYRTEAGAEVRPGVYFIRCSVGDRTFKTTRIVNSVN